MLVTVCGSDVIRQKAGESLAEAAERIRKEDRYVTVASFSDDGWYGDDGFPMTVKPFA